MIPTGDAPTSRRTAALEVAAGVAEVAGGGVLLLWERPTGLALGVVLGIVLVVEGSLTAFAGFGSDGDGVAHGIRGVVTAAVGIVLLAWPDKTPLVLAIIVGGYLIGFGFYRIMSSVIGTEPSSEVAQMLIGSVAVIGGFLVIANPPEGLRLLAVVAGIAAVLDGLFRLRRGIKSLVTGPGSAAA